MEIEEIRKYLKENTDEKYCNFNKRILPTVNSETFLGVRTPILRSLSKEIFKNSDYSIFLADLPHKYFEENQLHTFLVSLIKDFDFCIEQVEKFLPYIDNWATCDQLQPKIFAKNRDKILPKIEKWLFSGDKNEYTVRFAIEMAMNFYLDENFDSELMKKISTLRSEKYYINMMIAWYFATALAKQWDASFEYIKNKTLDVWTHNKTIQKAIESNRITDEKKTLLRTFKIS